MEKYEQFNPEFELQKLRAEKIIPHEYLDKYKEELFRQREEIAILSLEIQNKIEQNPDISYEELGQELNKSEFYNHFSEKQLDIFLEKFKSYIEIHQSIQNTINKYKKDYPPAPNIPKAEERWEREFFHDLFDFYPKGTIKLNIEPMFLYWETNTLADFQAIHAVGIAKQSSRQKDDPEVLELARKRKLGGAFVIPEPLLPGLKARVGILGKGNWIANTLFLIGGHYVQAHEQRHAIDFGLEPLRKNQQILKKLRPETPQDEIEYAISDLVELSLEDALRFAKSEILAFCEPVDLFYNNWKGIRDFLIIKLLSLTIDPTGKSPAGKIYHQLSRTIFKSFFSHKEQKQLPGKVFQNVQIENLALHNYNYIKTSIDYLNLIIKQKTGRNDMRPIIENKFLSQEPHFRRRLLEGMVAAEVLGRHTQLNLKELMWLLQNEPLDHWKKLAERADNIVKKDYRQTLNKSWLEYKNLGLV